MNYIDIIVLAFIALSFIFGFFGKAPKKIFKLIFVVIAIITAYFVSKNIVVDFLYNMPLSTVGLKLEGDPTLPKYIEILFKNNESVRNAYDSSLSMPLLVRMIVFVIAFFITGIASLIVIPFIGNIIVKIAVRKKPKNTAWKTLGIPSLIKGTLVSLFLISPIVFLAPILTELPLISGNSSNVKLKSFAREISSSEIIKSTDKFLSETSIGMLTYSDNEGNKYYFYQEETGLASLIDLYSKFEPEHAGVSGAILEESDEYIKKTLQSVYSSNVARELLLSMLSDLTATTVTKEDFHIDSEIESVILLKNLVNAEDYSTINISESVDSFCNSYLVDAISTENPGALASMDDVNQTEFKNVLQAKYDAGEITQGRYNVLMSLFEV